MKKLTFTWISNGCPEWNYANRRDWIKNGATQIAHNTDKNNVCKWDKCKVLRKEKGMYSIK